MRRVLMSKGEFLDSVRRLDTNHVEHHPPIHVEGYGYGTIPKTESFQDSFMRRDRFARWSLLLYKEIS